MSNTNTMPSLPDRLRQTAGLYPDHIAIDFAGKQTSFREFDQTSDQVAAGLAAQGVLPGDRVALYCVNCDLFAQAYFGIIKAGATVVPINLMLNPKEIQYILADAGVRGLIYHELFAEAVSAFRNDVSTLSFCVSIGVKPASEQDIAWASLLSASNTVPEISFNTSEDIASILYTSGTTGKPKGAMLTHKNLVSNTTSVLSALTLVPGEDVFLVVLPMFHAFAATVGMLTPLLHGITFVPVPRFDPELVVNTIASTRATVFLGVPSMYSVLLNIKDEQLQKFSSIRFCVSGGAAMPKALMQAFEARFNKLIYEGDGPTECGPVTCVNPIGGTRKLASVGLPIPNVDMKIFDADAKPVAINEVGEICVRGPNVMKGYWNRPDDTAATFFGDWLRTGDLGYEDEDGYFFIVDRIKDLIIVNGMNVYPRVIEEVLYQHPAIGEAAVIGEPDDLHGENIVAVIALKNGAGLTASEVRTFCRGHLGRHEIPKKVLFMDALPKNAAGKILKRELRKHGELERGVDSRVDV